jgi:hypothetical protein
VPHTETRDCILQEGCSTHSTPRGVRDERGILDNCQLIVVPLDAATTGFSFNQHRLLYGKRRKAFETSTPLSNTSSGPSKMPPPHFKRMTQKGTKTVEGASNSFPPLHILMDSEWASQHTRYTRSPIQTPISPVPQFACSSPKGYNHKLLLSVTAYLLDR